MLQILAQIAIIAVGGAAEPRPVSFDHLWVEAETLGPLHGSNFSFLPAERQQTGAWAISGPGVADAWTQGGESEFMSVAARADAAETLTIGRDLVIPADGSYTLWVRYSDYREKEESFGVRIRQGERSIEHLFGREPLIDELDAMKLLWDWSFAWDSRPVPLRAGAARLELFTTGPTGARRQVDCLCLTRDETYRPFGREKPDFAAWFGLRQIQRAGLAAVEPFAIPVAKMPEAWRIATRPPAFLWNVGKPWSEELAKPAADRVDDPFSVDEPLLKDFLAAHRGKPPLIYREKLSGPVWHIPEYPTAFGVGSPFLDWLGRNPERPFALLLNYADPRWPKDADRSVPRTNLAAHRDRFYGYIAGESVSHSNYDSGALQEKIRVAKTRREVLAALREIHTASVAKKFSDYHGTPVSPEEAWAPLVSCLSANMEAFSHALCAWGVERIGHENTANSPALARRLAFLRGAARQFGKQIVDYQSCNFGDAATMYSRNAYFYPASSRYVLDNSYDAFAGAGMNWLWKDYLLWHLAGVSAFYNEQGVDLFWKPGGNSAGDGAPVQLSPKGKVAEAALKLAREHPRGTQWTPVAFLLDEAHGWAQERFSPGSFGFDPELNPAVLAPGLHEAGIRGWFDVAWFPAPATQNEPASASRQTYVNGIFGDLFDVIVNAPGRTAILRAYPVVIVAGEVVISTEWGKALSEYVEGGGTLVVCARQLSGEGVGALGLPKRQTESRGAGVRWLPTDENQPSAHYQFEVLEDCPGNTRSLAKTGGDETSSRDLAVSFPRGKGRLIYIGIPVGLGLDERPTPLSGALLRHLVQGLAPVRAAGDVEWVLNRLEDGRWLIALLNNSGVEKPQHGVIPTRHEQGRNVVIETTFPVRSSEEWLAREPISWNRAGTGAKAEVRVPAGAARLIVVQPES